MEKDLNQLKNEREQEQEKDRLKIIEFRKSVSEELERKQQEKKLEILIRLKKENEEKTKKLEAKLKNFYYWLFGIALVLLLIIGAVFFYLRSLAVK